MINKPLRLWYGDLWIKGSERLEGTSLTQLVPRHDSTGLYSSESRVNIQFLFQRDIYLANKRF
jgi:hypothetical protein